MNYTGKKLGFGCMRMPILKDDDQTSFNYEKIEALFDMFLENGFTYFDTAHTYHGYKAEEAVGKALVARHKRDSFQIATKMPMRDVNSYEDMEKKFDEQLANLQTDYIDFYLLHNLGSVTYRKAEEIRGFEFGFKKKAEGKIKYFGFSFHDTPELLEEIGNIFASNAGHISSSKNILNCSGKKVLIVDDSDINLKLAARYMSQFNFIVTTATSGKDCVEYVKNNDYDIIFIDHMMPEMDGVQTVKAVEATGKKLPPIIALTANGYNGIRERFINEGFTDYLQKPFNFRDLNKLIIRLFGSDENKGGDVK